MPRAKKTIEGGNGEQKRKTLGDSPKEIQGVVASEPTKNATENKSGGFDRTGLVSWQLGLCERVAQGDSVGAILKDYEISNAKFIQERDSNPEFKAKLDEAFGIVAEMVEYSMMNLALTGNATERKNYAPILLEKYGRKMPAQPEEDAPSGESEGL